MARKRSPNRDKAYEIWKQSGGEISNRELANQLNISEKTISGWKAKDKWIGKMNEVLRKNDRSTPDDFAEYSDKKKEHGGKGNKNAVGHGAPPKNQNARTHGLFAKYLPEDVYKIAKALDGLDQLELLWGNITLQYAKIIHAQQIMHVVSKDELIQHVKSDGLNATTYEFQYAWDRQAKDLTAQSKAMSALNAMIKQYDELCRSDLATEEQRLRIEKLKLDIKDKSNDDQDEAINIVIKRKEQRT